MLDFDYIIFVDYVIKVPWIYSIIIGDVFDNNGDI
jgi:hypothetical protein